MNARTLALLLATWLAFGSVFLAIKIGIAYVPPILLASIRFLAAGAILCAIGVAVRGGDPDPIGRRQIVASLVIAVPMALVNGMVMLASAKMDSWIVSVLTCTIPLWSYATAVISRQRSLEAVEMGGVLCGILGIVVLLAPIHESVRIDVPLAVILLASAMAWGATSVFERGSPIPKRPLLAMGLQTFFAGIYMVVWGVVMGELKAIDAATVFRPESIGAILYLIFVATVIGYGAYMILIVRSGATIANSFGYVAPAIAVVLGWLVLGESVTMRTFAAFALIVLAVTLIVAPHPLRKQQPIPHRIH